MELIQSSYAEINLDNLIFNYREINLNKHRDKKICCVIKANAYGHGYEVIARTLEEEGVDYFATSSLQEAILLKKAIRNTPVMTLTAPLEGAEDIAVREEVETTVFTYDQALRINDSAKKNNKVHDIHIKLDTGMNRIGFKCTDESLDDIIKISTLENINIKGVFTHFASADMESDYTKKQTERFIAFLDKMEEMGISFEIVHMDNDAGAIMYNHKADMIRLGIGLYGVYPSRYVQDEADLKLRPLMSLKAYVTNIKYIEKGQSVSYGCTFTADKKTKVATIGAGYADGVPRLLSNKGFILVDGVKCPIIGNVCMDQIMVDIKDLDLKVGNVVEVFGEGISVDDVADMCSTISYEILCNIGPRVPRLYKKGNKIIEEKWCFRTEVE